MKWQSAVAATAAALSLAGCGQDAAYYLIDGPDYSLTLMREQTYFWRSEWDLALMTTHLPECMRRHTLKPAPMEGFKAELYRSLEGAYILRQGDRWYVADAQKCRLQQYPTPPAEPGDLLGSFEIRQQRLQFIAAARPVAPAASAPARN